MKTGILRKKIIVLAALLSLSVSVSSCFEPVDKKTYLDRFEHFVDNVRRNHHDYKKSDWDYADKRFEKFSTEWHRRFEDELTLQEELKVAALMAQYQSYKGSDKIKDFYKENLKEDVDKLKEKIKYYIDNDMDEDLEKVKQGAKEIGDSALKVVEEIIREIKD